MAIMPLILFTWHTKSAMMKEGWRGKKNLMEYPGADCWGGLRCASCLRKVSIRDVPRRLSPSYCQRNYRKSGLKAIIDLYIGNFLPCFSSRRVKVCMREEKGSSLPQVRLPSHNS